MDVAVLSSNWRELQQTLPRSTHRDSPPHPSSRTPKRRRAHDGSRSSPHGHDAKQRRLSSGRPLPRVSHLRAGTMAPHTPSNEAATPARLAGRRHDRDTSASHTDSADDLPAHEGPASADAPHAHTVNAGRTSLPAGKFIALDCEMVGVGPHPEHTSQLARVSVVDYHGRPLYDSYVLPVERVTDYRTPISGIRPAHLAPTSARPFAEVQAEVAHLTKDRILVGHALQKDLGALLLGHPRRDLRDTVKHPAFRRLNAGWSPSLKMLASAVLGIDIQGGEHSSIEDARAAMLLFQKEKDAFEAENVRNFGRAQRPPPATDEVDTGGMPASEGGRKKRPKKKKKGRR